jgi:uncharacterized protein (TIGR03083 family)
MDSDSIWRHIDDQRSNLADLFDGIDDARWSTPSLCDGWTVRDVAVHLTHSHMSMPRMIAEAARAGFRFNTMIHQAAVRDPMTPRQAAETLRAMCGSRKHPPGTAERDPLMDTLVHGQDIAVPLGIDWPMPADAAAAAAERLWAMRWPFNPRRKLPSVEFVATDAELRLGQGPRVEAPIRDILMVFAGRPAPISERLNSLRAG